MYLDSKGKQSEFRSVLSMTPQTSNSVVANFPQIRKTQSENVYQSPKDGNFEDNVSHLNSAGDIHTSNELNKMKVFVPSKVPSSNVSCKSPSKISNNQSTPKLTRNFQSLRFKKPSLRRVGKSKRLRFQSELGFGTQTYMHRYRKNEDEILKLHTTKSMGHILINGMKSPVTSQYHLRDRERRFKEMRRKMMRRSKSDGLFLKSKTVPHGHVAVDINFLDSDDGNDDNQNAVDSSDSDISDAVDTPLNGSGPLAKLKKLAELNPFSSSNSSSSARTRTKTRNKLQRSATAVTSKMVRGPKRVSRRKLKVDYKSVTKLENFGTSLHRVSSFMSKHQQKVVKMDLRDYKRHCDDDDASPLRDHSHLLDDITFGDVTAYNCTMTEAQRQIIRQTLRRRKWERRRNEIEARHAILCANEEPEYKEWLDRYGDIGIVQVCDFVKW